MKGYLHGRVVHNHAVEGDFRVTAGNLFTALQEEAITQLPAPTNEHIKMYHVFQRVTQHISKKGKEMSSVTNMMLALCTAVTRRRPLARAVLNA